MLPTGETVAIPQWASESTMQQIAGFMSATNKVDQKFVKLIDSLGGDMASMQRAISSLTTTVRQDDTNDDARERASKKFTDSVVGAAKSMDRASRFFGDAEKPLSGLKEAASSVWDSLRNSSLGSDWIGGLLNSNNRLLSVAGASIDVAADAFLAFAGWNAAKYEQFAQAQASAIDLGIMLQGGAREYDNLRFQAQAGGITYTRLLEVSGQYGDAMLGLGATMGTGTQRFSSMFSQLNDAADRYGDLGMTSTQMVDAYAEYLSYARRTGRLNRNMNATAEEINNEFINLQIETSAIASLTSLSRSEAMRMQLQAYNIQGEAAVFSLREAGLPGQATVADAMIRSLGMVKGDSAELNRLLEVYQQQLMTYKNDMGNFDLDAALGPSLSAAINTVLGEGFITNLEEMTRNGEMSSEEVLSFVVNTFNQANTDAKFSTNAAADSIAGLVRNIQAASISIQRNFGNLGDAENLANQEQQTRTNIGQAGRVTAELNSMTRRFLEMQEALTLNMDTTATAFDTLLSGMRNARSVFDRILESVQGEENTNDFGGIENEDGELRVVYDSTGAGTLVDAASGTRPVHTPGAAASVSGSQTVENTVGSGQGGSVTQAQVANAGSPNQARGAGIDQELMDILSQAGADTGLNVAVGSGGNEMTLAEVQALQARQPNRVTQRGSTYYVDGQAVRTGSNRHDHGGAADVTFTDPATGRMLSMANNEDLARIQAFVRRAREYGATGIGAGQRTASGFDYMGEHSVHIGFGSDTYWGDDGRGDRAPQWLRDLYEQTPAGSRELPQSTSPAQTETAPPAQTETAPPAQQDVAPSAEFFPGVDRGIQEDLVTRLGRQSEEDANRFIERLRSGELFDDNVDQQGNIVGRGSIGNLLRDIVDSDTVDLRDPQTLTVLNQFANSIQAQHRAMQQVTTGQPASIPSRLFGGLVSANMPYIVGDQLGLQTAELFVPETAGRIVNNRELHNIVSSTLTDVQQNANIANIDLSSLIQSKEETLAAANELRNALKTMLRNAKSRLVEDITNSR